MIPPGSHGKGPESFTHLQYASHLILNGGLRLAGASGTGKSLECFRKLNCRAGSLVLVSLDRFFFFPAADAA